MKKFIKNFVGCLLLSILVVGCSPEEDTTFIDNSKTDTEFNEQTSRIYKADLDGYLRSFYSGSYVYGDSIVTEDSNGVYKVKEVIVGTDTEARGYVVEDLMGEPLYFADVDRSRHSVTVVDLKTEVSETFSNLSGDPIYNYNGYDLIEIVEGANNTPDGDPYVIVGVKIYLDHFWEDILVDCSGPQWELNPNGTATCYRTCTRKKVRFFVSWSSSEVQIGC